MSLVGPRPAPPREVDEYDIWHRRRLSVRPGMTGLWQVEARFDHHFDDRAALDLRYIDQWSLWMDLGSWSERYRRCSARAAGDRRGSQ